MGVKVQGLDEMVAKLKDQLANAELVGGASVNVEAFTALNADPGRCPWVGCYGLSQKLRSRTLGAGTGYRKQEAELIVMVQTADVSDPVRCAQKQEDLVGRVLGAILDDASLGGTCDMIADEINVDPIDFAQTKNQFIRTSSIRFTALGTTRIS